MLYSTGIKELKEAQNTDPNQWLSSSTTGLAMEEALFTVHCFGIHCDSQLTKCCRHWYILLFADICSKLVLISNIGLDIMHCTN